MGAYVGVLSGSMLGGLVMLTPGKMSVEEKQGVKNFTEALEREASRTVGSDLTLAVYRVAQAIMISSGLCGIVPRVELRDVPSEK